MPVVDLPGNRAWTFVLKTLTCVFDVHNMAADDMFFVVIIPIKLMLHGGILMLQKHQLIIVMRW